MKHKTNYLDVKVLFLSILLSLFSQPKATAQEWAPIGAEWTYEVSYLWHHSYTKFEVKHDTILNGKVASVIYQNNFGNQIDDKVHPIITYEENSVVYWYNSYLDSFTVLYDFNLNQGDSWFLTIDSCEVEMEVISVDYDTINGFSKKVLIISSTEQDWSSKIVEGFGGLSNGFYPELIFECEGSIAHGTRSYGLRCYYDPIQGQIVFNENVDCEYSNVSIDELNLSLGFKVYPNPSNGNISIELNNQNVIQSKIEIVDMMGKVVFMESNATNNNQIDLSYLPKGIYFLRLSENSTGEILGTQRLVLTR